MAALARAWLNPLPRSRPRSDERSHGRSRLSLSVKPGARLPHLLIVMCFQCAATLTAFAADGGSPGEAPAAKRLKRSEAFLGIHFDFHAGPDCTEIGRNTTREMITGILDAVKPDDLQIDCKGHTGFSSYPTKVGNPAVKAFRAKTGVQGIPKKAGDPHWHAWIDFHREAFRKDLRHCVGAVRQTYPEFEIASDV